MSKLFNLFRHLCLSSVSDEKFPTWNKGEGKAAMDVLNPVYDFFYNATTGALTDHQKAQIAKDTVRPGASPQEVNEQQAFISDFLNDYWPARTPGQTLWDDITGDPLGLGRSVDGGDGQKDWTWAIVILVAVIIFVFLAWAFFG